MSRPSRGAFTLIELLVVAMIIAILIAVLLTLVQTEQVQYGAEHGRPISALRIGRGSSEAASVAAGVAI